MIRQLKPDILEVGAVDFDRKMFDELIPLPDGTSYNAYLVRGGDKTALLDTVDPSMIGTLVDNLVDAGVTRLDYVISHHAEQDHSGGIRDILTVYPEARVVTNAKCRDMLMDHLHLDEDLFIAVEDRQTLSLGKKTLRFVFTPWVHWPETMCTFLEEDRILFSCDFFGSHLASTLLFADENDPVYEPAKRYYAEIMMPFRAAIRKNLQKIGELNIEMIAPSHGPVYRNASFITGAYADWTGDSVANEVVVAYVSMHGSTRKMVDHLVGALAERKIKAHRFNMADADLGKLAMSMVDAATIVIGAGTVLGGPHPHAAYACTLANALRPKTRFAAILASYGWSSRIVEQIGEMLGNIKAEMLEPVLVKGDPRTEDLAAVERLADRILAGHESIGIVQKQ